MQCAWCALRSHLSACMHAPPGQACQTGVAAPEGVLDRQDESSLPAYAHRLRGRGGRRSCSVPCALVVAPSCMQAPLEVKPHAGDAGTEARASAHPDTTCADHEGLL